jgi:hypothetical protein
MMAANKKGDLRNGSVFAADTMFFPFVPTRYATARRDDGDNRHIVRNDSFSRFVFFLREGNYGEVSALSSFL